MIIKTGKINKSRGNISLTIGKEDVKKHNLEEGDFVILTPQEYEELKTSSEIEVSTLEVVPDDEAVVKLESVKRKQRKVSCKDLDKNDKNVTAQQRSRQMGKMQKIFKKINEVSKEVNLG